MKTNSLHSITMKLSWSRFETKFFLILAGFLHLAEVIAENNEFLRCYNTSIETHCFTVQYNDDNNPLITNNDNARQRCNSIDSSLITIKDEETNSIVQSYMSDSYNPFEGQYVWTDAYRINDYNNTHTWHWVNSALPNLLDSALSPPSQDSGAYSASLEFKNQKGNGRFYLTPQQPYLPKSYICEYPINVSKCSSSGSNVLQYPDRCYVSFIATVSWYDARNLCLKNGGDLASFPNVTSINFTSWLDSSVQYWIGLRFTWYIWKDSGEEVQFSKWATNPVDWTLLCVIVCSTCAPSYSWTARDCNTVGTIYVVCHTVTPLQQSTFITTSSAALPVTTSVNIVTQTGITEPNSAGSEKRKSSPPIALAVGVGVGVGVPVIAAIIVIIACVVRRHQSKTPETSATTGEHIGLEKTSVSEVQTGKSEDPQIGHYATVRSLSPSNPSTSHDESTLGTQYAPLSFAEAEDLKWNKRQSPLNVL